MPALENRLFISLTKAKNLAGPTSIHQFSHGQPPSVPNRYLIQHFYSKIPKIRRFPSIFGVKLCSPFRVHLRTRNKTKRREPITTTTRRTELFKSWDQRTILHLQFCKPLIGKNQLISMLISNHN